MFSKLKEVFENRRRKETLDAEQQYHELVGQGFKDKLSDKDADRVGDVLKRVGKTFSALEEDVRRCGEVQELAKVAATLDEALRNNGIARRAMDKLDKAWEAANEKYQADRRKTDGEAGAAGGKLKAAAQARQMLAEQYSDLPEGRRAKAGITRDRITNEINAKRLRLGQVYEQIESRKKTVKASKGNRDAVQAAQGALSEAQRDADEWSEQIKADEGALTDVEKILAAV